MRSGESYRLKIEILGIITFPVDHQPRTAVTIPKNSTVTVVAGPLDGERLVDVAWDGKTFILFAQDLRECGELADGAKA